MKSTKQCYNCYKEYSGDLCPKCGSSTHWDLTKSDGRNKSGIYAVGDFTGKTPEVVAQYPIPEFGAICKGESICIYGPHGSRRTSMAFQVVAKALLAGKKVALVVDERNPSDVATKLLNVLALVDEDYPEKKNAEEEYTPVDKEATQKYSIDFMAEFYSQVVSTGFVCFRHFEGFVTELTNLQDSEEKPEYDIVVFDTITGPSSTKHKTYNEFFTWQLEEVRKARKIHGFATVVTVQTNKYTKEHRPFGKMTTYFDKLIKLERTGDQISASLLDKQGQILVGDIKVKTNH